MMKIIHLFGLLFLLCLASISANAQTTYKDVAPIFIANCATCHHTGGIEFPLTNYSAVLAYGTSILNDVQSGRMPPWPPDANYKHYAHERILSATDKTKLVNWINAGMLPGDTTLAPPVPVFTNTQLNGTPDLILKFPKYTSTSTTTDKYICLNIPNSLTQDRYIRAFEYVPSNPAIIHHAVVTIDTTNTAVNDLSGNCTNFQGQVNIGDYAPGMGPTVFPGISPTKLGMRMKANSTLSIQLHIPEGTAGQADSSEVHFFFYPINEPNVRPMFFETILQNWSFYIPANDSVVVTQKYPTTTAGMPIDISLYSSFVHSHNTCTRIINYAYKNTDTIPLIKVPHWDFHWQGQYTFDKMVKLPIDYHLFSSHLYDNTTNNPITPNHNAPVVPGLFTSDEMLFDSFIYTLYQAGDENVDIAAILANDPLLYPTSNSSTDLTLSQIKVYPNPFTTLTNIDYTLLSAQYVQLSIYDNLGKEVQKIKSGMEASGNHSHTWDGTDLSGKKLPRGIYFYKLQAGQKTMQGKIVLE